MDFSTGCFGTSGTTKTFGSLDVFLGGLTFFSIGFSSGISYSLIEKWCTNVKCSLSLSISS